MASPINVVPGAVSAHSSRHESGDSAVCVRVFGTRTANTCGPQDAWRDAATWVARSLTAHFGDRVRVEYIDVFSPDMDAFPDVLERIAHSGPKLPLVFVAAELLSAGERISGPAIRRFLEKQGVEAVS